MMRHELFEVGSYDYSDLDERLTKPVEWTEEDLKLIAENYRGGIPLTEEHDKIYIGIGNDISYEEGKLFIEIPDELDMEGKGLSPKVDVLLKDNGDSFGIDTMSLIDVGVTKSPRKITLLNSDIAGDAGDAGNPEPAPQPQPQPQPPSKDTNVATSLLLEKLQGKDAEIGKLQEEIKTLKEESEKYEEIKKAIEENKEFIDSKDDILKELSELRNEAKYNFNYNENQQDKEIIDKLLSGDVDMELMEKLAERRIKIEASNDGSTPGGRNPSNSGDAGEIGETGSTGDEDAPSFTTREEYNKILKDMGFNRTRI